MIQEAIRSLLPNELRQSFDDIVSQKILGASNHIRMIGDMFVGIAKASVENKSDVSKTHEGIKNVADYFDRTRGQASQAVSNAIAILTRGLEVSGLSNELIFDTVLKNRDNYNVSQSEATDKIVQATLNLTNQLKTLFVYDYSSTVDKFLSKSEPKNIIIAESRIINGGYPFITTCQNVGHTIKIIPDAAILYYLQSSDCALMGAETFYPDGTGFNTTGSDIVALGCREYDIPLYMLTPLIKVDVRPVIGLQKQIVFNDFRDKYDLMNTQKHDLSDVDFNVPELLGINERFISAFVTEQGVIPANQLFGVAMKYYESIGGNIHV